METETLDNNPAADATREEYGKIMTDPTHPMHAGYLSGDKKVNDYIDALYRRTYGSGGKKDGLTVASGVHGVPPTTQEPESQSFTTDYSGDAEAEASIDTALRHEFGDDYNAVMEGMRSGAAHLFEGDEGQSALTVLAHRISEKGPKAEALGIRFLADLSKL